MFMTSVYEHSPEASGATHLAECPKKGRVYFYCTCHLEETSNGISTDNAAVHSSLSFGAQRLVIPQLVSR